MNLPRTAGPIRKWTLTAFLAIVLQSPALGAEPWPFDDPPASASILTLWAHSDIQPYITPQRNQYQSAVEDVRDHLPYVDAAIVAGDIAQDPTEDAYRWYTEMKARSGVARWLELAGNHDMRDTGVLFREHVRPDLRYTASFNNLLVILMSDESGTPETNLSDETFEWWRELVENAAGRILITVTHAPLKESGLPRVASRSRMQIERGERFVDVLRNRRLDLWLSGHIHANNEDPGDVQTAPDLGGAIFVDVSSIRAEWFRSTRIESRIIHFACGSDKVLIRSRDHERNRFDETLDAVFTLSSTYRCEE